MHCVQCVEKVTVSWYSISICTTKLNEWSKSRNCLRLAYWLYWLNESRRNNMRLLDWLEEKRISNNNIIIYSTEFRWDFDVRKYLFSILFLRVDGFFNSYKIFFFCDRVMCFWRRDFRYFFLKLCLPV